jgi:hypothetical protein
MFISIKYISDIKELFMKELELKDIKTLLQTGDFDKNLTNSAPVVVVILAQSWCGDWQAMQHWLPRLDTSNFYNFVYDQCELFDEIVAFKENSFKNNEIPYLRYYKNGVLVDESNYIKQKDLEEKLKLLALDN